MVLIDASSRWSHVCLLSTHNITFQTTYGLPINRDPIIRYGIGALIFLTNCTRPDITFVTNLLARFSSYPTRKYWNGIKHVFRYLRRITNFGLFYSKESKQEMIGYADASYLSDPHKTMSQTGYVFTCRGTTIS